MAGKAQFEKPTVWGGLAAMALFLAMIFALVAVIMPNWIEKAYPSYKGHTGLWEFCEDGKDKCPETDDQPIPSKWETGNRVVRAFCIISIICACCLCCGLSAKLNDPVNGDKAKSGAMSSTLCVCICFLITWAVYAGISPKKYKLKEHNNREWRAKDENDHFGISFWLVFLGWILTLAALVCIALHKPARVKHTPDPTPPPPPPPVFPPAPPVPPPAPIPAPAPAPTPAAPAREIPAPAPYVPPPPPPEQSIERDPSMRPSLGCGVKWLDEYEGTLDARYKDNVCVVENVEYGGPAEAAGLQPEDILRRWNGKDINGSSTFKNMVMGSRIGETVDLTVIRPPSDHEMQKHLTLGSKKGGVTVREHVKSTNTAWSGLHH